MEIEKYKIADNLNYTEKVRVLRQFLSYIDGQPVHTYDFSRRMHIALDHLKEQYDGASAEFQAGMKSLGFLFL